MNILFKVGSVKAVMGLTHRKRSGSAPVGSTSVLTKVWLVQKLPENSTVSFGRK